MTRTHPLLVFLCCLIAVPAISAPDPAPAGGRTNAAVEAAPRPDGWWQKRHREILDRIRTRKADLIFIGDSITHSWEKSPDGAWDDHGEAVWQKYYAHRHALNLGFSGDRTQHVLWRLDHGEIDGIAPRVAVLLIGSNNSNYDWHTPEEIAAGITDIIVKLRTKLPRTRVLVLGIFPRGEKPDPQRRKNEQANAIVAEYVLTEKRRGNRFLEYLDLASRFLTADGTLPKDLFPDYLHPNSRGYEIWAEAMEPKLAEMLGETP